MTPLAQLHRDVTTFKFWGQFFGYLGMVALLSVPLWVTP